MSLEKITSKIISDAEASAAVVLDEAKAGADGIIEEAKAKAAELLVAAEKEGFEEKEKLISRKKAVGEIDGRKMILQTKQKQIAGCFEKAVEKLASLEKDDYIGLLAGLVTKTGETEGELILNQKDRAAVGEALVQYLAAHLSGSKITLSEETRNIRGGFLLKKGSVYMNGTVEALVDEAKEELTAEVAGQLFQ